MQQGLKPASHFATFMARLKPCRCYKAATNRVLQQPVEPWAAKSPALGRAFFKTLRCLELFVEFAGRAGDKDAAANSPLAVLHPLHDSRRFAALGAVRGLRRIHYFLAVASFCNFRHGSGGSPLLACLGLTLKRRSSGFDGAAFRSHQAIHTTQSKRGSLIPVYMMSAWKGSCGSFRGRHSSEAKAHALIHCSDGKNELVPFQNNSQFSAISLTGSPVVAQAQSDLAARQ